MKIRINIEYLLTLAMLMVSIIFQDQVIISWGCQILLIAIYVLYYVSNSKSRINKINIKSYTPYIGFLIFGFASSIWALNSNYAMREFISLLKCYTTVFLLCASIYNFEDINKQLKVLMIVIILTIIYLLIKTPSMDWKDAIFGVYGASTDEGRIGRTIGYHPNAFGTLCFIFIMICLSWYYINKKRRYLYLTVILILILLFTKSRTSILMLLVGITLFYFFSEERKTRQLLKFFVALIFLLGCWWAMFNIPFLYKLVGFRFEGILGTSVTQDASTLTRFKFLQYAISLFMENPLIGVGLDNFKYYSYLYNSAWAQVYSHSNWGELLANTGLIGTSLYYIPQFLAIYSMCKNINKLKGNERKTCALFLMFLIVFIIFDVQKISYNNFYTFYIVMLSIITSNVVKIQKNRNEQIS